MINSLYRIFLLGFSSGLPFLLILSTLSVWLAEVGISKTMIGVFAWVSVPYSLKFLWGALVDRQKIPFLTKWLGLRRSWILCGQMCVWLALCALGACNPAQNLILTAFCALLVGCGSAIQDIAIEAYRIEILPQSKIGVGASVSVLGYRLGMLCAGAGTIFLATYFKNWSVAYNCIAACMLVGICTTLLSAEPIHKVSSLQVPVWKTFKSVVQKLDWQIVFPFILSYKIADTVLNVMSMPFLVEIGFNNLEIAYVAKTFGIGAMILGGVIGGVMSTRYSMRQFLLVCIFLQAISSALFLLQAQLGNNISCLFVTMGVENLACGMSQVALIAYMSHLCTSGKNTALIYAVLTSFASLMRVCFSSLSGWLADLYAWPQFYGIVCISCLPSLFLVLLYVQHFTQIDQSIGELDVNQV